MQRCVENHDCAEFQQKLRGKYSHFAENQKSALQLLWNML